MRALAAVVGLLVGAACNIRQPETLLYLEGRVVTDSGAPVADLELEVTATDCQGLIAALDPAQRERLPSVRTAADGRYLLRLFHAQRQGKCLFITATTGPGAPGAQLLVSPYSNPRGLPDLVLWESELIVTDDPSDGGQSVEIPPSPFTDATQITRRWSMVDAEGRRGWTTEEYEGMYLRSLPECLAEDFIVGMRGEVQGYFSVPGEFQLNTEGTTAMESIQASSWTATTPLSFPGRAPVSRGVACSFSGVPQEPCPVTDGHLRTVFLLDAQPGANGGEPPVEGLRLTFPNEVRAHRLVVRWPESTGGANAVEVSADGIAWTNVTPPVTAPSGSCGMVLSDPGFPVRQLRLLWRPQSQPNQIREVSVFED